MFFISTLPCSSQELFLSRVHALQQKCQQLYVINHNIKTIEIHTSLQTVLVINHPKLPIVPHAQYVCTIPQIPKEATCNICLIIKRKKKNCGHTLASNRMSGKCEILCNLMASLLLITISNIRERQVYRNPAQR